MSQINVNRIKDSNEGAPDFPSGVNVSGVTSTVTLGVTNLTTTNLNVLGGVCTATTFDGSLPAAGTPTLGLGVTINASGVNISGVATAGIVSATTLYGDGANLTGIALTIAPLNYNPSPNGVDLGEGTGIGLTFNQAVKAGSGEVTLRQVGAAGTVVQTWGVGSSITYSNGDEISMSLVSNLAYDSVYHLSYPSGAFTNIGGDLSYVGTGYTFDTRTLGYQLFKWGRNQNGQIGDNSIAPKSSPVQIPGTTWLTLDAQAGNEHYSCAAIKNDGTLWTWGWIAGGQLGLNQQAPSTSGVSSPTQVPGTTWTGTPYTGRYIGMYNRVGGELWVAGNNSVGGLGQNDVVSRSSPVQIPGTTWATGRKSKGNEAENSMISIKTDGTLWASGKSLYGNTTWGHNVSKSSPTQIPGTTWRSVEYGPFALATKTDGTLWAWGINQYGELGQNDTTTYSSPRQIGAATDWSSEIAQADIVSAAIKTDGTLWSWGYGGPGSFGTNESGAPYKRSSPVQTPGTTWSQITGLDGSNFMALKTDGTLWVWGGNTHGTLGQNTEGPGYMISSPTQIPGDWGVTGKMGALKNP